MKKKLEVISRKSQVAETENTGHKLFAIIDQIDLTSDPNGGTIVAHAKQILIDLTGASFRIKKRSDLEEKQKCREDCFRGLYFSLKGNAYHPSSEIESAIHHLYSIVDNYGLKILSESFSKQSAQFRSMLDDLATTESVAAIALVPGCDYHIKNLEESQDAFMKSDIELEEAKARYSNTKNATELKIDLLKYLNKTLIPYFNVMETVLPSLYEGVVNEMAQVVFDHNVKVKSRSSRMGSEDNQSEEGPYDDPSI